MGIIIQRDPDDLGNVVPFPIVVRFTCDTATAFFCRGFEDFRSPDGLIGARTAAVQAGWVERKTSAWCCRECAS